MIVFKRILEFTLFVLVTFGLLTICSCETPLEYPCIDGTCDDIRAYVVTDWKRTEMASASSAENSNITLDERGYYHVSMGVYNPESFKKRVGIQVWLDEGYIVDMNEGAPNYTLPDANLSFSSNYWYDVYGGIFMGNRYNIFSESNGQSLIPSSNSSIKTAVNHELINVVQSGVKWFSGTSQRDPGKYYSFALFHLSKRFIGDTISAAVNVRIGGSNFTERVEKEYRFDLIIEE